MTLFRCYNIYRNLLVIMLLVTVLMTVSTCVGIINRIGKAMRKKTIGLKGNRIISGY